MSESEKWAPAHWTPGKIRRFLADMRRYVKDLQPWETYEKAGITDALMSIDCARSQVEIVYRKSLTVIEHAATRTGFKEKVVGTR